MLRLAIALALVFPIVINASLASTVVVEYRLTDLGYGTGTNDSPQDITESGKVGLQQNVRAYVWEDGTRTPTDGVPNGNTQMRINELGHIAGAHDTRAYLWRDNVITDLGVLEPSGRAYTFSSSINDLDQIVGTSYRNSILSLCLANS
ncbi:MAG: hypothetical protein JW818_07730 [Pirellulales bacterium]|nr:hypothetical protein [Pirellulales bacterium]